MIRVSGVELVDSNVWLALVYDGHVKHESAKEWFETGSEDQFSFCRVTQMALLRHLTNKTILGNSVLSQREAWDVYDQLRQDDRITFLQEPAQLERHWRIFTGSKQAGHWLWTDAYLAAFAIAGNLSIATCDRGFAQFTDLRVRSI